MTFWGAHKSDGRGGCSASADTILKCSPRGQSFYTETWASLPRCQIMVCVGQVPRRPWEIEQLSPFYCREISLSMLTLFFFPTMGEKIASPTTTPISELWRKLASLSKACYCLDRKPNHFITHQQRNRRIQGYRTYLLILSHWLAFQLGRCRLSQLYKSYLLLPESPYFHQLSKIALGESFWNFLHQVRDAMLWLALCLRSWLVCVYDGVSLWGHALEVVFHTNTVMSEVFKIWVGNIRTICKWLAGLRYKNHM